MAKSIYLAGPIKDCTWEQKTEWRNEVKEFLGKFGFEFSDPMEFEASITECTQTPREMGKKLVQVDLEHIGKSEIILANMWKISIGTIMELVYASQLHKNVYVVCEKKYESLWLLAHCDRVFRTLPEAVNYIKDNIHARGEGA